MDEQTLIVLQGVIVQSRVARTDLLSGFPLKNTLSREERQQLPVCCRLNISFVYQRIRQCPDLY